MATSEDDPQNPSGSLLFPSEIAGPLEQYERLLESGCAPVPEDFAAGWPAHRAALLSAIAMVVRLRSATSRPESGLRGDPDVVQSILELAALTSGQQVLQFRILHELGRGGMGIVYQAHDENLGRDVALKVINPSMLRTCESAEAEVRRFAQEARAMAALAHPHLVRVNGIHRWKQAFFFDMELLSGVSLGGVLREFVRARSRTTVLPAATALERDITRGLLWQAESARENAVAPQATDTESADSNEHHPTGDEDVFAAVSIALQPMRPGAPTVGRLPADFFDRVARIGAQTADALEYAHAQGVLHRDIKPANLMVDRNLTVKLMDFGLARSATERREESADSAGSLRYMAPERFESGPSPSSDVYSLGATLLELISAAAGVRPSETVAKSDGASTQGGGFVTRFPLSTTVPRCPADLSAVIDKAIAAQRVDRYASAAELASDLRSFLDRRPVTARRWSLFRRALDFIRHHHRAAAVMLALTVLLLISIPSYLVMRTALHDSREANRRAESLLEGQLVSATVQAVRTTQKLIELGLRDDGLQELAPVPPAMRSWDTDWLEQAGRPDLVSRLSLANGDWNVLDAAINHEGQLLAMCTAGGQLCVWDLRTGQFIAQVFAGRLQSLDGRAPRYLHHFEDRTAGTRPVDWPDPCCLSLAWSGARTLRCLLLNGTALEFEIPADGPAASLTLSPGVLCELKANLNCGAWSPDGRFAVVGTEDGVTTLVDLSGEQAATIVLAGTGSTADVTVLDPLTAAVFCHEESLWLLGHRTGRIRAVTLDGRELWGHNIAGPVWSLDVKRTQDRMLVAAGGNESHIVLLSTPSTEQAPVALTIELPGVPIRPQGIHLVRFHPGIENQLLVTDSLSRVLRADTSTLKTTVVEVTLSGEPRLLQDRYLHRFVRPPNELPEHFQRTASVCRHLTIPGLGRHPVQEKDHVIESAVNVAIATAGPGKSLFEPSQESLRSGSQEEVLLIGGRDNSLTFWHDRTRSTTSKPVGGEGLSPSTASDSAGLRRRLAIEAGPDPVLLSSPNDPRLSWTLDRNGRLQVLNHVDESQVAVLDLSTHAPVTITVSSREAQDVCLVLCADGVIRATERAEGRWETREFLKAPPERELLSLTADATLSCVAAVDRDGGLQIWSRSAGGDYAWQRIAPDEGVAMFESGRVAVSSDGKWIAAGSSGQSAITAVRDERTGRFRAVRNELDLAGDGVRTIAIMRNADTGRTMCFATDSLLRLRAGLLEEDLNRMPAGQNESELRESACEQLVPTADNRRIAMLQTDGQVLFLMASNANVLSSVRSSLKNCRELCFSRDGRWMIVADATGRLERFDARPDLDGQIVVRDRLRPTATVKPTWHTTDVRVPLTDQPRSDFGLRLVTQADGRWCVAVPAHAEHSTAPYLGKLLVAASGAVPAAGLTLETSLPEVATSLVDFRGVTLAHHPETNRPAIVCRTVSRSAALTDVYSGDLLLSEQRDDGSWTHEVAGANDNFGFSPLLFWDDQSRPLVFHFSFANREALRSQRAADGQWRTSPVGHRDFRAVSGLQNDARTEWLLAGDSSRNDLAPAPTPMLSVSGDTHWQYTDWPVCWQPLQIYGHGSESALMCRPADLLRGGVVLQRLAMPLAAGPSTHLPIAHFNIVDVLAESTESFLCLCNDNHRLSLYRCSSAGVTEVSLPDQVVLPRRIPSARLERLRDGHICLVVAAVSQEDPSAQASLIVVRCTAPL